jgi:ABC-type multidrug transport system fused ATPase/permease subunit
MAITLMLGWWYGRGWAWAARGVLNRLDTINQTYSVPILLRTWFAPWKQIRSTATMQNFFSAAIDNAISRAVGATVRTFMLLVALVLVLFTIIGGLVLILLWPLLPAIAILLPVWSLMSGGSYGF